MTVQVYSKEHYIELFRKNKFNCFPIPEKTKIGDYRYKASKTPPNQVIMKKENYGIIPTENNAIVDFDNKEKYRSLLEEYKKNYVVIETPHGWHLPVIGLTGIIKKTEMFDYSFHKKKIIEIQGPGHCCVGPESSIFDKDTQKIVRYQNVGTQKFYDAQGKEFSQFVNSICKKFKVESRKKISRSSNKNMRDRFLKNLPPTKGMSNDYFFQAALRCNTDGLSKSQALDKIRIVYDKWRLCSYFSGRPWSDIEDTIATVYKNDSKLYEGRPKGKHAIDRTSIAQEMIDSRKLYSDTTSGDIFENVNGFLEKINNTLQRELQNKFPEMEPSDFHSIKFKLVGLSDPLPSTNKTLVAFKNGKFSKKLRKLVYSNEIADIGFRDYCFLSKSCKNKPVKFLKVIFENVEKSEHSRVKAGLRSVLSPYLDPKISINHGGSGVGKSTGLLILDKILGEYSTVMELDQLLSDKFIKAHIKGKLLLVLQDLPQYFKDFSQLKALTGEQVKTERGFQQDSTTFENKLKIWASTNYLPRIPENEKNSMYDRRLSLIHNRRKKPYPENPTLIDEIAKEEGEKILSWILNLSDDECNYEVGQTVRKEWEELSSPEISYLKENWEISGEEGDEKPIMYIIKDFEAKSGKSIDLKTMKNSLISQGYVEKYNVIKNIKPKNNSKNSEKNVQTF